MMDQTRCVPNEFSKCGPFEEDKGEFASNSFGAGGLILPRPQVPLRVYTPFFATVPFPSVLNGSHVEYFLGALKQLSHLVHEVAVGLLPGKDDVCDVKRTFLIFHISHFVDVSFADTVFMESLTPVRPDDTAISEYIGLIQWLGDRFVTRWREATEQKTLCSSVSASNSFRRLWIAVKNTADAISSHTVLQGEIFDRICIRLPKRRLLEFYITEGNIPSCFCIGCLVWSSLTAFAFVILVWMARGSFSQWCSLAITILTVINFSGFLCFLYALVLRQSRLQWLSELLAENHLAGSIASQSTRTSSRVGKDVVFTIRSKEDVAFTLAIKSSVLNRQIILIGIVNTKSLVICSWNRAAHMATGIAPEQVIGKSLEAVMEAKSIATARRLLMELRDKPRQQQRLLLNNARKNFPVTIKATATIAHVDGIPIGMFAGTVVDDEQQAMMSYFSRVDTYAALRALRYSGCASSILHTLVLSNEWDALKRRTTNAMRSWCLVTLEEFLGPLKEIPESSLKIHVSESTPKQFQCDYNGIKEFLAKLKQWFFPEEDNRLELMVACVTCGIEGYLALQFDVTVPDDSIVSLRLKDETLELLSLIGCLTLNSSTHFQFFTPIALRPFDMTLDSEGRNGHSGKHPFMCTFLLHEPVVAYRRHFYGICDESRHRIFPVSSLSSLKNLLSNFLNEVTAVILSAASPDFGSMLSYCREKGQFVSVVREGSERSNDGTPDPSADGPPSDVVKDGDYILHRPLCEERWGYFLEYLYNTRNPECNVVPHAPMELTVIRQIGRGSCSFVDLVQDKLTGGYMACKTVFISHERTLDSLREEVDIMRQCSSPFIVKCIVASHSPCTAEFRMILQFCPDSLERHARRKRIKLSQLPLYAFQLLSAVQHLHENGIAHRDIKPANILMMNEKHLKLADFGSAQRKKLKEGSVYGVTAQFMAPERLLFLPEEEEIVWRETPMDGLFAEDIWSVGLTLLDIIGMYPLVLKSLNNVKDFLGFYMQLRDSGDELPFEIPKEDSTDSHERLCAFHDFIRGMLQLQPKRRPRASELLQHLFLRGAKNECDFNGVLVVPGPNLWLDPVSWSSHHLNDSVLPSQHSFFTASASDEEPEDGFSEEAFRSVVNLDGVCL
ncbi:map kinase [Trypanosoma cruzi cruzi]|nr:map kinase [Trypanosoma cruzi cruzi]